MNTIVRLSKKRYTRISEISLLAAIYALTQEVAGYEGPLIRVYSFERGTEKDIFANKDGTLDINSLLNHALGDRCVITIWYDQTGSYDAIQTDASKRPLIVDDNGSLIRVNGEPAISFDNTNDNLFADVPYLTDDPAVTILSLYTRDTNAESDAIVSSNPANHGIWLFNNTTNKSAIFTYRDSGVIAISSLATPQSQTVCHAGISTKKGIDKVFNDGEMVAGAVSKDANIVMPSKIVIGGSGTGSSASGSKIQCVAIWRSDESSNMQRYSQELKSRYDSSIDNINNKVVISDSSTLLPTGEIAYGRLIGDIRFSEQIKVFPWTNRSAGGFGDFEIINIDNQFNFIVTAGFTDVEIMQLVDGALIPFGKGEINKIGFSQNGRIKISLKSVLEKLNVELPTGRFDNSYPELENEKKLFVAGKVNLIEPRLIDPSKNEYFVSDNLHGIVKVYDSGISVPFTKTPNGFILAQNPSGRILATVQGHSKQVGYEEHIYDHVQRLLSEIDIDFNSTELSNIWPGISSSWSGTNENVIQAINELLDGFISYMYVDSFGTLRFGRLQEPVNPIDNIYQREFLTDPIVFEDTAQGLSEELLNSRNFNPYSSDQIGFQATASDKINLIKEYRRTSISKGLHHTYKGQNVQMKSQSLGGQDNGMQILDYIIQLWSKPRSFYTVQTTRDLNINSVYQVFHSKKNLNNGKNLLVIGKERSTLGLKKTYTMWG